MFCSRALLYRPNFLLIRGISSTQLTQSVNKGLNNSGEIWALAKCGSNVIVAWPTALINISCSAEGIWLRQAGSYSCKIVNVYLRWSFASFFPPWWRSLFYVHVGGTDVLTCKPIKADQVEVEVESPCVTVLLLVRHWWNPFSRLLERDFWDVTPQMDLDLLLDHVRF